MAQVGIDIGGSSVKAVRLTESRATVAIPHDGNSLSSLRTAIRDATDRIGLANNDTLGICLPGLIDIATGILLRASNLPFLEGEHPSAVVERVTGHPVQRVVTDASAWGHGVWLHERTEGRLLVLAIGTGVGAAVLDQDKLVTLDGLTPGHVGMIDVSLGEANPPCAADGSPGVLEAYIGARSLRARFGAGDLAASIAGLSADDQAIRALVRALRICHAIYKPDAIRLVGGIGAMLCPHIPVIEARVRDRLTRIAQEHWTLGCIDDHYLAAAGVASAAAE